MTKSKTQSSEHINPNVITLKRINPYSKNKSPKTKMVAHVMLCYELTHNRRHAISFEVSS